MFSKTLVRGHVVPLMFGVAMLAMGCQGFFGKASNFYDKKISAPTTQAVGTVGQVAGIVAATTPIGTPLNSAAQIALILSGGIIALDRLISGGLKGLAAIQTGGVVPNTGTDTTGSSGSPTSPPGSPPPK